MKAKQGGFLIAKIHFLAGRLFQKMLTHYKLADINPAQGRILFVLWQEDDISIQELAKRTALGKSTLTSMLDRLEAAGYLTRVPSREDRRKIHLRLTDKNQALFDSYSAVSEEMNDLFYWGFSEKEIDQFETYLERVFDNLSNQ